MKVIERFDCTGCGDVDTSKIVIPDAQGMIQGLSGRKLKLTNYMKTNNISENKEFRVGLKCLSDIYTTVVRDKIVANYKLKNWDEQHKRALASVQRDIDSFDNKNSGNNNLSVRDKLKKEDNDNSLEFLNYCEKKYADIKTTYDCVLFETNEGWIAVIDLTHTVGILYVSWLKNRIQILNRFLVRISISFFRNLFDFNWNIRKGIFIFILYSYYIFYFASIIKYIFLIQGDLENALQISEYTKTHDIQSIDDFISVSINVYDNGNMLELVGMCSKWIKL